MSLNGCRGSVFERFHSQGAQPNLHSTSARKLGPGQLKVQDTRQDSPNFLQEKAYEDACSPASFLPKDKTLSSPAPSCPYRQDEAFLRSRGEQGFLLPVLEGPTGAERNWPKLQPSIRSALGSGDSAPSSLPGYACSGHLSLQDESVTARPSLELGLGCGEIGGRLFQPLWLLQPGKKPFTRFTCWEEHLSSSARGYQGRIPD